MDHSQSPIVQRSMTVIDKVQGDTACGKAILNMQEYDQDFDIEDLTHEVEELTKEFFCNYLTGNQEYIDTVMGGPAHSFCKAMIELRLKEKWTYKLEELIDVRFVDFRKGRLTEGRPQFTYQVQVEEYNLRVCSKTGEDIEDALTSDGSVQLATYEITLARHSEPDIELTGHYWELIQFEKQAVAKQIV